MLALERIATSLFRRGEFLPCVVLRLTGLLNAAGVQIATSVQSTRNFRG